MSQQATRPNLFSTAKKVETTKGNKSKMPSLAISEEMEKQLKEYQEASEQLKKAEAKKKIAEGYIKTQAVEIFLAEVKTQGRNIGSFKLGNITVIVQDRYTKMEDTVAEVVANKFPNVVERNTEYLFDQAILRKYIDAISDALQNAEGIPDNEKASLILAKEVITVKKGTIDTLPTYGDQMGDLFQAIAPIISLRAAGE